MALKHVITSKGEMKDLVIRSSHTDATIAIVKRQDASVEAIIHVSKRELIQAVQALENKS